ncbi:MAG: HD domain-containing protein [Proteobacteria bacterium]|nr:HD domain-containing protein [Pseudomonadota bacterium]
MKTENEIQDDFINKTVIYVKQKLEGDGSGHDWWHIQRVWKMAERIAKEESADQLTVQLAALLHDIADWKSHGNNFEIGPKVAREWLETLGVPDPIVNEVAYIVGSVSFKGVGASKPDLSLEGKIVQDADRLDATGAMGIARTFAYGGHNNRLIYDPNIPPITEHTENSYVNNISPSINHFYEKLLLLKNLMNTQTGRKVAENRHVFMEKFLEQFYKEWDGID